MTFFKINRNLCLFLITLNYACSESKSDSLQSQIPLELSVDIEIIGATSSSPFGDGSGTIKCKAKTNRSAQFIFTINGEQSFESFDGLLNYSFSNLGVNNYTVDVSAVDLDGVKANYTEVLEVLYDLNEDLIWSEEFSADGPADLSKWTYEVDPPNNGSWWNDEDQHYTDREKNSYASNGIFYIRALRETFYFAGSTKLYTSSRLKTQKKFSFKYGRVEIRAKLPSSQGTWPAVWMLGSNVDSVSWPSCGEIDIIEQFSDKSKNFSTAHWRDTNGKPADYGNSISSSNLTSEFNNYVLDWSPNNIIAYLNGVEYYRMNLLESMPFNKEFFIIMNLAMGGSKGAGEIETNFEEDTLEIDYIRVYKN